MRKVLTIEQLKSLTKLLGGLNVGRQALWQVEIVGRTLTETFINFTPLVWDDEEVLIGQLHLMHFPTETGFEEQCQRGAASFLRKYLDRPLTEEEDTESWSEMIELLVVDADYYAIQIAVDSSIEKEAFSEIVKSSKDTSNMLFSYDLVRHLLS